VFLRPKVILAAGWMQSLEEPISCPPNKVHPLSIPIQDIFLAKIILPILRLSVRSSESARWMRG